MLLSEKRIHQIFLIILLFSVSLIFACYKNEIFPFPYGRSVVLRMKLLSEPKVRWNNIEYSARIQRIRDMEKVTPENPTFPQQKIILHLPLINTLPQRGDIIEARGLFLELPFTGEKDYASYLKSNGFTAIFEGRSRDLTVVKKVPPLSIVALSTKLKASIVRINERLLLWPQSEFLTALITGRRERLPQEVIDNFRRSGTMHILAVSGLHIGFLVLFIALIFKMLHVNQYVSSILLFAIALFYMIFIGDAPSVKRASLMVMCGILIFLFDRDRNYLNVLSLAFNILWIANPLIIINPGFILSFAATFAILFFVPNLLKIFGRILPPFLAVSLSVSFGIQIYLLPVMLSFFGTFSYINVVANLPIVPLTGLALAIEMLTLLVYPIFLPAAILFAEVNLVVVTTILHLARFFSRVAPLRVAGFPRYIIPLYFVIITVGILVLFKGKQEHEEIC